MTATSETTTFPGPPPFDLRVMIVGDSITHGGEADYTWRYRIWQWFQSTGLKPKFVGPFVGTQENSPASPPQPPDVPGEPKPGDDGPRTKGGYALDCEPEFTGSKTPGEIGEEGGCRHYSMWGRQAAQAKGTIREQVEQHRPNLLLVLLGFNDIGWFVSDAAGAIDSLREFVDEARKANPHVHFALGNIVQRTFMEGRQDLVENTLKFNKLLKEKCPEWTQPHSQVAYAEIAEHYSAGPHQPNLATYDGLHPNARGDIEIAYGFSQTLYHSFHLGSAPMTLPSPSDIPKRDLSPPKHIRATPSPMGVTVTWDPVYGGQYTVRSRIASHGPDEPWGETNTLGPRFDTTFTTAGTEWEYQVRTTHGNTYGAWSEPPVRAIADRCTAPAPTDIRVWPLEQGFRLTWTPPGPKEDGTHWDIDRYEVMYFDRDWPGAFICAYGARGPTEAVFENMRESVGHRHQMWMATWTRPEGGGLHSSARPVVVGVTETPPVPQEVKIAGEGEDAVKLCWRGDEKRAAGYRVHYRRLDPETEGKEEVDGDVTMEMEKVVRFLWPCARECEFWITAVNGELESGRSEVVTLKKR